MDKVELFIIGIIIIGILVIASILMIINQRNEFCQKLGYEDHTLVGEKWVCRKTTNDEMEILPIYCESGKCWKVNEATT